MGHTVLIVEDQWEIRKFTALALKMDGYKVLEAKNGSDAIDVLSSKQVDLVLTDWRMPEMGGAEMVARIRSDREYVDLPIIVMSCDRKARKLLPDMKSLGIVSWLNKPCRIATIRNSVAEILTVGI